MRKPRLAGLAGTVIERIGVRRVLAEGTLLLALALTCSWLLRG